MARSPHLGLTDGRGQRSRWPARWPRHRLFALAGLVAAPVAGVALAAWVVPGSPVVASAAQDGRPVAASTTVPDRAISPVAAAPVSVEASSPDQRRRAHILLRQAQGEVIRLTGVLSSARRARTAAPDAHRPAWDAAISALSDARARRAGIVRDLTGAGDRLDAAALAALEAEADAALTAARRGQALLAVAEAGPGEAAARAVPTAPAATPALTPTSMGTDAARTDSPRAPTEAIVPPATSPDSLAPQGIDTSSAPPDSPPPESAAPGVVAPESPASESPASESPASEATASAASPAASAPVRTGPRLVGPAMAPPPIPAPPRPATTPAPPMRPASVRAATATATAMVSARPNALDPLPPVARRGTAVDRTAPVPAPVPPGTVSMGNAEGRGPVTSNGLVDNLGRTLPSPPSVLVTGVAALPPAGTGPFRAGGPADWSPATVPVPRPRGDPAVSVHPDYAGPIGEAKAGMGAEMGAESATAAGAVPPTRPPGSDADTAAAPAAAPSASASAPASAGAPARLPPAPVPSARPAPPARTVVAVAVPPSPPPAADSSRREETLRPAELQPFDVGRPDGAAPGDGASPRDEFARIARTVAAQHDKARQILDQVDPVRADLLRRLEALPDSDVRREGLREVRAIIESAETSLTAAVQKYGALARQLDFVLEDGAPTDIGWTPRDAVRQAIAASADADRGVAGLRLSMARFQAVLQRGTDGPSE
ncbi:hypothetical protein F1188_12690 [Roseospira marina]|uniref:Uncharacterized protein n=1 Tax=Roseospira marina TaxID=140057 RepID=A0A5M6IAE7_9PROT|nr:hypothetical protein [Roseospira marina]KAA5605132.1 hypothetical protein F1188_12690 [Roseospira marina]MBB4314885.1 hypothetical protein [Roseospira marina]MBB5087885.1 hypothetical protein [Roseospira marina]